ncbi:MAG: RDD family protein [Gammaproteobacteria bacterium]|nr:RDD family protein [Gammaproteobacteria bacterium]
MNNNGKPATLSRKLLAGLYDGLLLSALLLMATLPATLLNGGAIRPESSIQYLGFIAYLLLVWFLFYGWFWTHGGQTLGMAAWRIKAVAGNGQPIGWRAALIRWSCGCLGLANLTGLFNQRRLGWHESLSATRTVALP